MISRNFKLILTLVYGNDKRIVIIFFKRDLYDVYTIYF